MAKDICVACDGGILNVKRERVLALCKAWCKGEGKIPRHRVACRNVGRAVIGGILGLLSGDAIFPEGLILGKVVVRHSAALCV